MVTLILARTPPAVVAAGEEVASRGVLDRFRSRNSQALKGTFLHF